MSVLEQKHGRRLLQRARQAIESELAGDSLPDLPLSDDDPLTQQRGIFVTLRKPDGALRGCIGYTETTSPLYVTVKEAARLAAFKDSRFSPVTEDEIDHLLIEVSVLSLPMPVDSWRDIKLGLHGVTISKSGRRALFLPQVATEQGWDISTTLTQLSLKAGLLPDDWKEGATFHVFTAQIFSAL